MPDAENDAPVCPDCGGTFDAPMGAGCRRPWHHADEWADIFPHAKCPDCGHDPHEFVGCTGDPTPSDLWAGVSVSACDCSGVLPPGATQ